MLKLFRDWFNSIITPELVHEIPPVTPPVISPPTQQMGDFLVKHHTEFKRTPGQGLYGVSTYSYDKITYWYCDQGICVALEGVIVDFTSEERDYLKQRVLKERDKQYKLASLKSRNNLQKYLDKEQ